MDIKEMKKWVKEVGPILDDRTKAIKERYGDRLAEMMAEKVHMEHFTRVRE